MSPLVGRIWRKVTACAHAPRKRLSLCLLLLVAVTVTVVSVNTITARLSREDAMEEKIANMQSHIQYLEAMYRARQEEVYNLERQVRKLRNDGRSDRPGTSVTPFPPAVVSLLKNITGTRTAAGLHPQEIHIGNAPFVYHLLPHLMSDPHSLRPAYHLKGSRNFTDVVIGVPTVKRDKESYLLITLRHLIDEMTEKEKESSVIVVYVGEEDLEFVVSTALKIEVSFPTQVASGLIEILSPNPSYYPDLTAVTPTLGDSYKRFRWRSKHNLDTIYLMGYAWTKGTYYLMLEDDVISRKGFMTEIKHFTTSISVAQPGWYFIEYCQTGGIGKLFRSSGLMHFITYVQLFYLNAPIDWLLESYLDQRICRQDKGTKECLTKKLLIRPRYKTSLFQHIGIFSSLRGKVVVKNPQSGPVPLFFPHQNPPAEVIATNIEELSEHTLIDAYEGRNFFWGKKPKQGAVVEIWFKKPTNISRYTFRSSNVKHTTDKFTNTVVEALPTKFTNFTAVGSFDEFGLAEGSLPKELGPLSAIRLRVTMDLPYWVILSEIELLERDKLSLS